MWPPKIRRNTFRHSDTALVKQNKTVILEDGSSSKLECNYWMIYVDSSYFGLAENHCSPGISTAFNDDFQNMTYPVTWCYPVSVVTTEQCPERRIIGLFLVELPEIKLSTRQLEAYCRRSLQNNFLAWFQTRLLNVLSWTCLARQCWRWRRHCVDRYPLNVWDSERWTWHLGCKLFLTIHGHIETKTLVTKRLRTKCQPRSLESLGTQLTEIRATQLLETLERFYIIMTTASLHAPP